MVMFLTDTGSCTHPHRSRHQSLILRRSDYGIAADVGSVAADEARASVERVGGKRVVVAHVVGRHQDVLADSYRKVGHSNAIVSPFCTVGRGRAVSIDKEVRRVVSTIVKADGDAASGIGSERRLEMIDVRIGS